MKLKLLALGLAMGIVWGLSVFAATIYSLIRCADGTHLCLLKFFYLGYSLSFVGSLIGLIWGFADGFVGGVVIAFLYNLFIKEKA